jgi:hypothetical protein
MVLGAGALIIEKQFEIPALKPPRFMVEELSLPTPRRQTTLEGKAISAGCARLESAYRAPQQLKNSA